MSIKSIRDEPREWEAGNGLEGCWRARGSIKEQVLINVANFPLWLGQIVGLPWTKTNGQRGAGLSGS
jgi:hypothetical protein